jgi:hypothetical protein
VTVRLDLTSKRGSRRQLGAGCPFKTSPLDLFLDNDDDNIYPCLNYQPAVLGMYKWRIVTQFHRIL